VVDPALVPASGGHAAGWFALSNDVLQPVPARATAMVAPGWGSGEQLRTLVGAGSQVTDDGAGSAAYDGGPVPGRAAAAPSGEPEQDPRWYSAFMYSMTALLGVLVG